MLIDALRVHAQDALAAGMRMHSQAEVGSALQVFHNLHELQQVRGKPALCPKLALLRRVGLPGISF